MTFIVTYRGADGAVRDERVEAANRAECFSNCRAKGILPLGMEESRSDGKTRRSIGKTQRSIRESERSISKTQRSILIAALVVVVLAGVGFWLWTTRSKVTMQVVDEKPKKTALAKEVTPAKAPKPIAEAAKPVATSETGKTSTPAAWRNHKLPENKRLEAYEKALEDTSLPSTSSNRLFRSGVEQVMGWIFATEVGDVPPPLPRIPDVDLVHLQEILDSKSEVTESDSERHAKTKQIVDFAKSELKKYLEKGGAPDEFLKYYHDQLKTAHMHRQIVQDQMMKVLQEEPERADEFLMDANKGLAEMGIKAVVMPERIRRRLGLSNQQVTTGEKR